MIYLFDHTIAYPFITNLSQIPFIYLSNNPLGNLTTGDKFTLDSRNAIETFIANNIRFEFLFLK